MKKPVTLVLFALLALSLCGCGILFPSAKMRATKNTPGFKSGFSDGCSAASAASADLSAASFRDKAMYDADPNYRAGWAMGQANCRTVSAPQSPNAGPVPDISPGGRKSGL
jgi:hypothetical protein